eukprot:Hpha_TRINITY_DN6727_c0_g1::TRINITY_DN6727_c0_g1_i1::g.110916::m.110916
MESPTLESGLEESGRSRYQPRGVSKLLDDQLWECVGDELRSSFAAAAAAGRKKEDAGEGIAVDDFVAILLKALSAHCGPLSREAEAELRMQLFRLFQDCCNDSQLVTWEYFTGHLVDEAWRAGAANTESGGITERWYPARRLRFATSKSANRNTLSRVPRRKQMTVEKLGKCKALLDREGDGFDLHHHLQNMDDEPEESDSKHEPLHKLWFFPKWGECGKVLAAGKFNTLTARNPSDLRVQAVLPRIRATTFAATHIPLSPLQYLTTAHRDGSLRFFCINEKNIKLGIEPGSCCQAPSPIHSLAWSAKHNRLFSGGTHGEVCQWSVDGVATSPRRGKRNGEGGGADLLSAYALINATEVQRALLDAAHDGLAGPAVTPAEARQRAAMLVQFFGLSPGDGLFVAEQPPAEAANYVAALAQLSDWDAQLLRRAVQGLSDGAGQRSGVTASVTDKRLLHVRKAHTDTVTALLFDAEGRLVTASKDAGVSFFDLELGDCLYTLRHHERGVLTMAFSELTQQLVTGGWEFCPLVWNGNSPLERPTRLVDVVQPHQHHIVGLSCPSNRPQIISADAKGIVKVWDSRKLSQSLQTIDVTRGLAPGDWKRHYITDLCYVAQESQMVVAGRNAYFYKCSSSSNPAHTADSEVTRALYSSETQTFYTASGTSVRTWHAGTGVLVNTFDLAKTSETVTALVVNPRGSRMYVGCSDGVVKVVKSATGDVVKDISGVLTSEVTAAVHCSRPDPLRDFVVCATRGGKMMFLSEDTRMPRAYNFTSNQAPVSITCACDCPSLQLIVLGSSEGTIFAVDAAILVARGPVHRIQALNGPGGESIGHITTVCGLGRNPAVLVGDASGFLGVYGLRPWSFAGAPTPVVRWDHCVHPEERRLRPAVTAVAYVPGDNLVLSGDERGTIAYWNLNEAFEDCGMRPVPKGLQCSPNVFQRSSAQIPYAEGDMVRMLWRRSVHNAELTSISVLPKYRVALTSGADNCVHLLHLATGSHLCSVQQGRGARAFSPSAAKDDPWRFRPGEPGGDRAKSWDKVSSIVSVATKVWKAGAARKRSGNEQEKVPAADEVRPRNSPLRLLVSPGTTSFPAASLPGTSTPVSPGGFSVKSSHQKRRGLGVPVARSRGVSFQDDEQRVHPQDRRRDTLHHLGDSIHIPVPRAASAYSEVKEEEEERDPTSPAGCEDPSPTEAPTEAPTEGSNEEGSSGEESEAERVVLEGEWVSYDWFAVHGGERCRLSTRSGSVNAVKLANGHPHIPVGTVSWRTKGRPQVGVWCQGECQMREDPRDPPSWCDIRVLLSSAGELVLTCAVKAKSGLRRGVFERARREELERHVPRTLVWDATGETCDKLTSRTFHSGDIPPRPPPPPNYRDEEEEEKPSGGKVGDYAKMDRFVATEKRIQNWGGQLCVLRLDGAVPDPTVRGPGAASVAVAEPSGRLARQCVETQWEADERKREDELLKKRGELAKFSRAPIKCQRGSVNDETDTSFTPRPGLTDFGGGPSFRCVARRESSRKAPDPETEEVWSGREREEEGAPAVSVAAVEADAEKQRQVSFAGAQPPPPPPPPAPAAPPEPRRVPLPPRSRSAGASTPRPRSHHSTTAARHWRGALVAEPLEGGEPTSSPRVNSSPRMKTLHLGSIPAGGVRKVVITNPKKKSSPPPPPPPPAPTPPPPRRPRAPSAPPPARSRVERRLAEAAQIFWEEPLFRASVQEYVKRDSSVPQRYARLFASR